jgi:ribosomal protein S8
MFIEDDINLYSTDPTLDLVSLALEDGVFEGISSLEQLLQVQAIAVRNAGGSLRIRVKQDKQELAVFRRMEQVKTPQGSVWRISDTVPATSYGMGVLCDKILRSLGYSEWQRQAYPTL